MKIFILSSLLSLSTSSPQIDYRSAEKILSSLLSLSTSSPQIDYRTTAEPATSGGGTEKECFEYGIDFNAGGDCDIKTTQNIESPRRCFLTCRKENGFEAWSWLTLAEDHPNPGQCVCKSCTRNIQPYPYTIAGHKGCIPKANPPCFYYGQTWCNINDASCKYEVFSGYHNPDSCDQHCLSLGSKFLGWSWGNNQANNPHQRKCYCFTSAYNPKQDFFFISAHVECDVAVRVAAAELCPQLARRG